MFRWVDAIDQQGGVGTTITYGLVFFRWLHGQLFMVEDYSYLGNILEAI